MDHLYEFLLRCCFGTNEKQWSHLEVNPQFIYLCGVITPVLFQLVQIHQVGLVDKNVNLFHIGHLFNTFKNLLDIFKAFLCRMLGRHSKKHDPCTFVVYFGNWTISLLSRSVPQLQVIISRIMFEMRGIKIDSSCYLSDTLFKKAISKFGNDTRFTHWGFTNHHCLYFRHFIYNINQKLSIWLNKFKRNTLFVCEYSQCTEIRWVSWRWHD